MGQQIVEKGKLIKHANDFIIDTIKDIERIVTYLNRNQLEQIRHLMLMQQVNIEKGKVQDTVLELHYTKI